MKPSKLHHVKVPEPCGNLSSAARGQPHLVLGHAKVNVALVEQRKLLVGLVVSLKNDDASLGIECEDRLVSAWFARSSSRDLQDDLLIFFSFSSSHGLASGYRGSNCGPTASKLTRHSRIASLLELSYYCTRYTAHFFSSSSDRCSPQTSLSYSSTRHHQQSFFHLVGASRSCSVVLHLLRLRP